MNRRIHFTSQMCAMEPILQMRKPRCREIPSHSVCGGGSRVKMQPRTGPAPKLMFFPKMLLLTLRDACGNKPAHRGYPTIFHAFPGGFFHCKSMQPLEVTLGSQTCHREKERPFPGVQDPRWPCTQWKQTCDGELTQESCEYVDSAIT